MQTISKQSKAAIVDISKFTADFNNPLVKAFKQRGAVFGFTAYFIVSDYLNLTQTRINDVDLLVNSEGKTYKVCTTKDIGTAYTKGIGRSKNGIDIKTHIVNQSDYLAILEPPVNNICNLIVFKTTDVVLDNKGIIQ